MIVGGGGWILAKCGWKFKREEVQNYTSRISSGKFGIKSSYRAPILCKKQLWTVVGFRFS